MGAYNNVCVFCGVERCDCFTIECEYFLSPRGDELPFDREYEALSSYKQAEKMDAAWAKKHGKPTFYYRNRVVRAAKRARAHGWSRLLKEGDCAHD
ncbi:MAG: hypothetical protein LBC26_06720 [Oscillospiraceae bacterium]|jgi:hypothetical protein|nr:hypothetical protein [Oscillospiraceae bacterium]